MDICAEKLRISLTKCRSILNKGYARIQDTGLPWLNTFCMEFLRFSEHLHTFLAFLNETKETAEENQVNIIYLCLWQIVTCVKYLEKTIKSEENEGNAINALKPARQYFLDRIFWCSNRLRSAIKSLTTDADKIMPNEELTFVDLMDSVLDQLMPYSSYKDVHDLVVIKESVNGTDYRSQAMLASAQIRSLVDLVLSHTLAFANVALKQDKKALSALCQKVLRECIAFQEECSQDAKTNESNRKLKAVSLENALYKLEDYINEALLRLIYTCFLDFKKLSIEKLRTSIKLPDGDESALDELIADFDVNIDRTTQIGIFAIAFAPNNKIKTTVRSCLASFESLDSCIIPSLQARGTNNAFSELLEQHFNEEVFKFQQSIQEIIDSHAFASCFCDILTDAIARNDKEYDKTDLLDLIKMGELLKQHFQLEANRKQLIEKFDLMDLYKKFVLLLEECQAVLNCTKENVEPQRVLKRFKILRSILKNLIAQLSDKKDNENDAKSQMFIMSEDLSDSQRMFASIGISPSIRSILYNNNVGLLEDRRQKRLANDSLKANCSKLPDFSPCKPNEVQCAATSHQQLAIAINAPRSSIRRKESLRTAMFKRQKISETEEIYKIYENNSNNLQISEILDQLTDLSANFSKQSLNKSVISK